VAPRVAELEDALGEGFLRQVTTSNLFILGRGETEERIACEEQW
jgi:hypothetical protein